MKIIAVSDLHGVLPKIPEADLLLICGDIVPCMIQRNDKQSALWFSRQFTDWLNEIPVKHVAGIAGNHDFYLYNRWLKGDMTSPAASNKFTYLLDSACVIDGIKIFGTPWCAGLPNWAFDLNTHHPNDYFDKVIPECDILLTHMPPAFGALGIVHQPGWNYMEDYSSVELRNAVKPGTRYIFCGHVHSGKHALKEDPETKIKYANVSVLDEDYKYRYWPLEIEWTEK